jgi:hypothetical protein
VVAVPHVGSCKCERRWPGGFDHRQAVPRPQCGPGRK